MFQTVKIIRNWPIKNIDYLSMILHIKMLYDMGQYHIGTIS